jgi:hypothetical protein
MYAKDNDGVLVSIKPGSYPIISSPTETRAFRSLDETTQGLLVEFQGRTVATDEADCWYALVAGEILVVWDDQLSEPRSNV